MAFLIANFSPLGGNARRGKTASHFVYRTTDTLLACGTSAYFNTVSSMLQVGDVIKVEVVDSVTTPTVVSDYGNLIIQSNALGVVDTYEDQTGWLALNVNMLDVSTAATVHVASPIAGIVKLIQTVINGAIATAPAVITSKIGSVEMTGSEISITDTSSAAGDVDSAAPTAANTVAAGSWLNFTTSGASTNTIIATITVLIKPLMVDAA